MREDVQRLQTGRGSVLAEYEPVEARGELIREGIESHGPWTMDQGP